ncbi:MAG: hypothetical protein WA988_12015 [Candidatus Nanopelagicales bacterium]
MDRDQVFQFREEAARYFCSASTELAGALPREEVAQLSDDRAVSNNQPHPDQRGIQAS